jgi:hypothetical protein
MVHTRALPSHRPPILGKTSLSNIVDRAEEETTAALHLAGNHWELALARKQLSEIRQLKRKGLARPNLGKSLGIPAMALLLSLVVISWMFLH